MQYIPFMINSIFELINKLNLNVYCVNCAVSSHKTFVW